MVNSSRHLDQVFHALSDETRRQMVLRLARGPATVGELGRPFQITKPAVTKHIKVLERAGLLHRDIEGRSHHCRIDARVLRSAERWMARLRVDWEGRRAARDGEVGQAGPRKVSHRP